VNKFNALVVDIKAAQFIPLLKSRGENSWKRFYEKAVEVNKAHGTLGEYFMKLTEEFSQYELLTVGKVQQIVCEVRADMELAPYFKQIKASAFADFAKLFIFEEQYAETDEPTRGPLEGYIPLKAIKAE
jgi:hypothetical protein